MLPHIIGSFRNGNADVRLFVSCANFAVGIVTSLKPCVPLEFTTVVAKKYGRTAWKPRRSWRISHSETFLREGIRSCMTCTHYTCGFCERFAKALVRHNGPKNAVPSRLVASCVAQLAASPCESSLILRVTTKTVIPGKLHILIMALY